MPQALVSGRLLILTDTLKVGKGVPRCYNCCPLAEMLKRTAFSSAESCLSQCKCRYKQTEDGWCFQSPRVGPGFPAWFSGCRGQALPAPSYHYFTNLEATWDLFVFLCYSHTRKVLKKLICPMTS